MFLRTWGIGILPGLFFLFLASEIQQFVGLFLHSKVNSIVGPRVRPPFFKQAKKKFSKSEVTMIVLDSRAHHFAKRLIPMIVLLSAAPIALWAQGQVPGYAIQSSKHYRQSGVGNGHGRSGSANLTARALLGKDNNTTVELTTGTLDSNATPPGRIARVQMKPLMPSGEALFAHNFTGLSASSGYYSFSWPSLHRGEKIQLQSGIKGIDGNRTDVVTVTETVKMRPDLAVQNLTFPETAIVQQVVNIRANITELNGDTGATTACVLAVDGSTVDQANNVYVDAGGGVTCEFSYTFSGAGTHAIQVSAANPVPGDWDNSNNTASGAITISTDNAEHVTGLFVDSNVASPKQWTQSSQVTLQGATVEKYSNTFGSSIHLQGTSTLIQDYGCAGATSATSWQLPVDISYTESMDGNQMIAFTDKGLNATGTSVAVVPFPVCNSTAASVIAQYGSNFVTDHFDYIGYVQYLDGAGNPLYSLQFVGVERGAGDVTYFSYGYQCSWWNSCGNPADYYTWNTSTETQWGTLLPLGSMWGSSIASQDASGKTLAQELTVPLTATQQSNVQGNSCVNIGPDSYGYTYQTCSALDFETTVTTGIFSF